MSKSKLKKQFLTLFLAVAMAVTSVNLTPLGTVTAQAAEESNALKEGKYYIKNVGTDTFLNSGNRYGTQASVFRCGQLVEVTKTGEVSPEEGIATYNINTHIHEKQNKRYLGATGYMNDNATELTIAKCEDGSFTIANAAGNLLTAANENTAVTFQNQNEITDLSKWRFLTQKELVEEAAETATEDNPADVTSLILDSTFSVYNEYYSNWERTRTGAEWKQFNRRIDTSKSLAADADTEDCIEIFQPDSFNFVQTLTDIPNGVYQLSLQGFARHDGESDVKVVYYANDVQNEIMGAEEDAKTSAQAGWTTEYPKDSGSGIYIPDSMNDAAACFAAGGYTNEFITVEVTDHTLKVGLKAEGAANSWVLWDNFYLRVVRLISDDEVAARSVIALIDKIGEVSFTTDCKRKLNAAREAFDALTEKGQAFVTNEQTLIDAEEAFDALIEAAGGGQETVDQLFADEVIDQIEAIGTIELTDACKAKIEVARESYEMLTDAQKAIAEEAMTNAENQFNALIPEQQVIANDNYYFVNTQTGRLLNGGNSWETKGSALSYGQLMTVKLLAGDTYHYNIQTHIKGQGEYLTADAWTDQAAAPLVIAKTANGNFTIANAAGKYLSANDTSTTVDFENKTKYSEWLILTPKEYREKVLKDAKNGPVDVTTLIFDPNFSRFNTYIDRWTFTATGKNHENKNFSYQQNQRNGNNCIEVYRGAFDFSQTITEIPNGEYELTVQGFYRNETNDPDDSITAPVYYIDDLNGNSKQGNFINAYDEAKSEATGGWAKDKKNDGKYIPDSKDNAGDCFTAGGYINSSIKVTVTNGELKIGVKAEDTKCWVLWDNFTLKLLSVDDSEYVNPVIALITAIGDVEDVELTDECKAKIDAAQAAYDELNDTQKGKVTNAGSLTKAVTRYNDLKAAAAVEAKMEAIGDYQFTTSYKNKMDAVKDEYDKLSEGAKDLVNKDTKDAFDAKYAQFAQDLIDKADELAENDAKEVTDLIDAIPALDEIKLADKEQIEAARDALDDLSELAAPKVSEETKAKLAAAEAKIKELEEAADMKVVDDVMLVINVIAGEGAEEITFTSDSRLAIEAAEKAYDSLSEKQETLMEEHYPGTAAKITAARTAYNALKTANAPIFDDSDYYIVNKSTGKYLNANAQIKASLSSYGQLMTLAAEDDKVSYTVDSHYKVGTNDHYLAADCSLGGEATALMIENSKDGNINITNENNEFLTVNARGAVTFAVEKSEGSEWMVLSRDELIAKLSEEIAEESPADVTSLIFDPGIDEKNEYYTEWSSSGANVTYRGDASNRNLEVYQGIFDFSQTIEDIPNGVYKLTVQGFYRPDGENPVAPVYYANDAEGTLMIIDEGARTERTVNENENGWTTERPQGSKKYVPNSMEDASECFSTGAYTNEPITVVVRDNELTIGVKATDKISWVIWDNFQLKLTKVMTDADFAAEVEAMIDAIDEVTADSGEAIKAAQAAFEALTEEQQALVSKDKLADLEAKATEYRDVTADPAVVAGLKGQVTTAIADAEAEELDKDAYEADSWTAYDNALKALQTLAQNPDAKKSQLEKALNDFKEASDGLVVKEECKPSDEQTQNLATAVTDAAAVNEADYVQDENWTAFQAALKKAQEIQGRKNATAAQVQKAMNDLDAAKTKLTPANQTEPADKTKLDKAVNDYKGLKEADYTAATWKEFKKALDAAKAVSENPDATQQEVDDALAALNAKQKALKKVTKVSKIKITADYTKLAAGKKATLKAAVTPSKATNKKVKWTVDKNATKGKYASINQKGVLTTKAKAAGKTITVTATAQDGSKKYGTIKIKVMKGGVKKVSLKAKSKKVKVKKKLTIKATVTTTTKKAKDANTKLVWKSSNTKVATVSSKGVVTGKKAGKTTITATSTDGTKKSAKVTITVTKK